MSKFDPEHWQQVKAVFAGALERVGAERAAFLDQVCAGDSQLRNEVESLLRSYGQAGSFMEAPAVALAAESLLGEQQKLTITRDGRRGLQPLACCQPLLLTAAIGGSPEHVAIAGPRGAIGKAATVRRPHR